MRACVHVHPSCVSQDAAVVACLGYRSLKSSGVSHTHSTVSSHLQERAVRLNVCFPLALSPPRPPLPLSLPPPLSPGQVCSEWLLKGFGTVVSVSINLLWSLPVKPQGPRATRQAQIPTPSPLPLLPSPLSPLLTRTEALHRRGDADRLSRNVFSGHARLPVVRWLFFPRLLVL